MDYKEQYQHLIEIEGIQRLIKGEQQQLLGHNQRLQQLQQQLQQQEKLQSHHRERSQQLSGIITELEVSYESHCLRLEELLGQQKLLSSQLEQQALQETLQHHQRERDRAETQLLEFLEEQELLQKELERLDLFMKGAQQTLEEIQKEVEEDCQRHQRRIQDYQQRIDELTTLLVPGLQALYRRLQKSFSSRSPLAFVKHFKCSECHMQLSRQEEDLVERREQLCQCPHCQRLLLPSTL